VFSGLAEFEGRAASFLAEGAARGERLMFVSDDPKPQMWPTWLVRQGALAIASTTEVYGAERMVAAASQRAVFEAALADAIRDGYSGIRVAADNTSLISGPERVAAWMGWEDEVSRFIGENPVTGLCAFDRTRADAGPLRAVMGVHTVMPGGPVEV
jgi:hypothetical protein